MYTKNTGEILRQLREEKGLLLRQVAAELEIDTALLSKIERGERNLKREQVLRISKLFNIPENDMIMIWLSDKIIDLIKEESNAVEILKTTMRKIKANNE
jgi:transcriptional regulator with XRE-family HTH domain